MTSTFIVTSCHCSCKLSTQQHEFFLFVGECADFDEHCGKTSFPKSMCSSHPDLMERVCPKMCNLCSKLTALHCQNKLTPNNSIETKMKIKLFVVYLRVVGMDGKSICWKEGWGRRDEKILPKDKGG